MTLYTQLHQFWNSGKFATSWIIHTDDLDAALRDTKKFMHDVINIPKLPIDNNPDFKMVQCADTKSLNVNQIRELQSFVYTTSTVSEYKFAIIYEADLMNYNAANCCLKILEEPTRNTCIFLLTDKLANLTTTIKSRCHKIFFKNAIDTQNEFDYSEYYQSLIEMDNTEKVRWLNDLSSKVKPKMWEELCHKLIKYLINQIRKKRSDRGPLLQKLKKIQQLVNDAEIFDLDKRHIGVLILELLIERV